MKALIKEHPRPGLSLLDIEPPRIESSDDVMFKVEYCALCVGEIKVYEWGEWAAADPTIQLPTVLGHEASGVVTAIGKDVTRFKVGDRIAIDPMISCGLCHQCRAGRTNMCENREIYGKQRGAFAEYAVLPERALAVIPDNLSLEEGALLENLGIAVHAVEVEPHDPGDLAVVIGAGPIGIMAAQTLKAYGVRVVSTDIVDSRLELAKEIVRETVISVQKEDVKAKILAMTDGRGADFVIEAAATQSALDQAFDIIKATGTVVTIGTFGSPISFNPFFSMTRREIKLVSTIGRTWETWRRMTQLINTGHFDLKPFISHILPMEDYGEGFDLVKSPNVMKVLLRP
jgi:2-desacetyl-2-hydroxyethyl bacteriochlorophyllide A dehydrogenase